MRPRTRRCRKELSKCQDCSCVLNSSNWTPSNQKYKRYICGPCWVKRQKKYAQANPNFKLETKLRTKRRMEKWSDKRKKQEADKRYNNWLKRKYGITLDDYSTLLAKQKHKCAICRSANSRGKGGFHVDHCHKTENVRNLLCTSCNMMLGLAKDQTFILNRAIKYLQSHRGKKI